ncbi:hypothetical protein KIN20_019297 [Parelaphostrongylus tenuis]|uniref:Secreted protein n=1 Tax=Parelaphostrongylus tenuis TaxID=148309 RepID=A0AAD5N223_PARTN|nr:hypothetical protein KIN20_019296 [Parelaphostrongylus tenuis]KAJ1360352.1 hypothetical protein KIN20_019297 [Parelaphostrongylus tenuis]
MDVHARIASHLIGLFILLLLDTISTVLGCGVMPAGQARTRSFTVTGFTLPTAMVYSGNAAVAARFPGVASTPAGAQGFVQRLVMQTVLDVLEKQARNAFLPDAVISTILDQLTVNIAYEPLECKNAANPADRLKKENSPSCNIVGNTVTSICTVIQNEHQCEATRPNDVTVMPLSGAPLTISGTLSTTNIIMANWSDMIWQNVLNRAVRMLASGPFASHFSTAFGTISGN